MSLKLINNNIRRIRLNGEKLNALIHDTAMLVLAFVQEHRNATPAQQLVMAMPASMRRSMLIAWFEKFSPINVKDSADFNGKIKREDNKTFVPFNLVGAAEEPFWKMAEATPERVYSFEKLLELAQKMGKTIEKKIEDGKVPEEDITSARVLASTLATLSVERVKAPEPANKEPEDKPNVSVMPENVRKAA